MLNIGFWNINRSTKKKDAKTSAYDLSDLVVDFMREAELDILCLAEANGNTIESSLFKLNRQFAFGGISLITCGKSQLAILTRLDQEVFSDLSDCYESKRWSAHLIQISQHIMFNLVVVHFPSKLHWSNESQAMECVNLVRDICTVEQKSECEATIVIGDFNMNPFEPGMVSANGLHALADLSLLNNDKKGRTVNGVFYNYFYNPMWNHFGDNHPPTGTYYHNTSTHISYHWHLFDQVLVRPSLQAYLQKNSTKICTQISSTSLVASNGIPDNNLGIDHLPIVLKLYI